MHTYYHPSGNPLWVNDDWIRKNTEWVPGVTPLQVLADNGFFQVKEEDPGTSHSPKLYIYVWVEKIADPYCIRYVESYRPIPLEKAKAWMLETYPDHAVDIEAATTVDELQQILDSIPQS